MRSHRTRIVSPRFCNDEAMSELFQPALLPELRVIGIERSAECARLHATSFARSWSAAEFEQLLGAAEILATGAVEADGGQICGLILSRLASDEAEVLTVAVDPLHRRRGIGSSLLARHLADLTTAGVSRLFLEVDSENLAALGLYARLGFRRVGERKNYYRAPEAGHALVLRVDLQPNAPDVIGMSDRSAPLKAL